MSFRDYLINYRMNVAAELLQDSNLLLSEVAELVSYYDYPQFSKMFKKNITASAQLNIALIISSNDN